MTDRKGCIERLLTCAAYLKNPRFSEIPFMCNAVNTMHEAVDLLKEQEAVEPFIRHGNWAFQCGKCDAIIEYGDKFCRQCGQEAKWK